MSASAWRIVAIDTGGLDLQLSRLQIMAGGASQNAGATVSASHAPISGSVAALLDAQNTTPCVFAAADAQSAGFYVAIQLAGAVDVDAVGFVGNARRANVMEAAGNTGFAAWAQTVAGIAWLYLIARDRAAITAAAPDGLWGLDDPSGTQPDLAGTRNATRSGGATVADMLARGSAGSFDPQTSGDIRIPGIAPVDSGAFAVVIDVQYTTTENLVIAEHGSDNKGWSLQSVNPVAVSVIPVATGGLVAAMSSSAVSALLYSSKPYSDGAPHRVVLQYNGASRAELWVDGSREMAIDTAAKPTYNQTYVSVGSRNGAFGLPAGSRIANFAMFPRMLTPAEIRALVALPSPRAWIERTRPAARGAYVPAVAHFNLARRQNADMEFGGDGIISGAVEIQATPNNVPVARRVRLRRSRDGVAVRETWSAPNGAYAFANISRRYRYDVEAWDHTGQYTSVLGNNIVPKPMPGAAP